MLSTRVLLIEDIMAEGISELVIACWQGALIIVGQSEMSDCLNVILNVMVSRVLQEIALGIYIPSLSCEVAQNAFILEHPGQIGSIRSLDGS